MLNQLLVFKTFPKLKIMEKKRCKAPHPEIIYYLSSDTFSIIDVEYFLLHAEETSNLDMR